MFSKKYKSGLTLSEILIVVVIVGLVVAVTVPAMLSNNKEKQLRLLWKKNFQNLSEATLAIKADRGIAFEGLFTDNDVFRNTYSPYLIFAKSCNSSSTGGCWHRANGWKSLAGTLFTSDAGEPGLILNNGSLIFFGNANRTCTAVMGSIRNVCGQAYMDVNGFKEPNTLGKDIFSFIVTEKSGYAKLVAPYDPDCESEIGQWAGDNCAGKYLLQ